VAPKAQPARDGRLGAPRRPRRVRYARGTRVALVYRHFNLTGSLPRLHVKLAESLCRRGHEVHVYSIAETRDDAAAPDCVFHGVPVTGVTPGRFSLEELRPFARNAAALLARERFDAVYTRLPSTWVGDVVHVPGVFRARHHTDTGRVRFAASTLRHPEKRFLLSMERRAVLGAGTRIHAESEIVRADLERYYGIEPSRMVLITPGIDLDEFGVGDREAARRELGLPDGLLILFCGHDFERKGLDRLIDAAARMQHPARLVVVGGGPAAAYEARAREAGVEIHFAGGRPDPARYYQAADIFALPTRLDMWGMPVLEAMAAGTPPVVTGNAGVAAAVADGVTGVVLGEPFRTDELASALDRLAGDPSLRERLGAAGLVAVRDHSSEVHADRVEQELLRVVSG
jgi:glycosyltransferase involved in cell wall biosynthesis